MTKLPAFSILTPVECQNLLARNHVGRLAFRSGRGVDVEPIGYVARENWLYMRSAWGTKLEALARIPYVAFEVDEVEGPYDWRSVVAHGTIYVFSADGSPDQQRQFSAAVEALRSVIPNTLTPTDSVPERQTVYGLHVDQLEGRKAESRVRRKSERTTKGRKKREPKV